MRDKKESAGKERKYSKIGNNGKKKREIKRERERKKNISMEKEGRKNGGKGEAEIK